MTDHFDGRRFFNPEPTDGGFSQYARRTLSSRRGLFDQDRTLWYGFVIEGPSGSVYFAGDTGRGSFLSAPEDAALVSSPRGSSAFLPELLWRGTLSEDEVF